MSNIVAIFVIMFRHESARWFFKLLFKYGQGWNGLQVQMGKMIFCGSVLVDFGKMGLYFRVPDVWINVWEGL